MGNELMMDVGQANELKLALRKAGFTPELVKKMCTETVKLTGFREVLLSDSKIVPIEHVIDGNADPSIPSRCAIVTHNKLGKIVWDDGSMNWGQELFDLLFLERSEKQCKMEPVDGTKLYHEYLRAKRNATVTVLDYLLAHPNAIPDSWKFGKNSRVRRIHFWGTVYRDGHGDHFVRFLFWNPANGWDTNVHYLNTNWDRNDYALIIPDPAKLVIPDPAK